MIPRELVYGVRPVEELLQRRLGDVEKILVAKDRRSGLGGLLRTARAAGIPVVHLSRELLARQAGSGAVHQGVAAVVSPVAYADPAEVCDLAAGRPDGLLVLVDRVVDPRNLGAILRTSAGAGADGVLLCGRGGVGLTPLVAKASAGAIDRLPVARLSRPAERVRELRKRGFLTLALDASGETDWHRVELCGRVLLIAGSESLGVRAGIRQACDAILAIRLAGGMDSLNVAVALGVVLFEAVRQREAAGRRS